MPRVTVIVQQRIRGLDQYDKKWEKRRRYKVREENIKLLLATYILYNITKPDC